MGQWRALDAVLQTSTIELFRSYEVAIAPSSTYTNLSTLEPDTVGAAIAFTGTEITGELVLAVPAAILKSMGHTERLRAQDWVRELTNQLLGRVKNRLMRYDVRLRAGVPSALDISALRTRLDSGSSRVYHFRSLRGSVFIALRGNLGPDKLRFKGSDGGPEEGELVVF